MTNASEARRLVELRKSAEKSSIASLKSMLTTSKNRIEEIKNEEFEADAQFQKIVYSHLKDSVTTSTVRSIVNLKFDTTLY